MIRPLLAIHLLVALRGSACREERDEEDDQRMAERHRASNQKECKLYMCLPGRLVRRGFAPLSVAYPNLNKIIFNSFNSLQTGQKN